MTDKKKYNSFELYRRLLREVRPYYGHIGVILVVTLLSPPLALLIPLPLKIAVDSVIGSRPLPAFLHQVIPEAVTGSPHGMVTFVVALMMLVALLGGPARRSDWLAPSLYKERRRKFPHAFFQRSRRGRGSGKCQSLRIPDSQLLLYGESRQRRCGPGRAAGLRRVDLHSR